MCGDYRQSRSRAGSAREDCRLDCRSLVRRVKKEESSKSRTPTKKSGNRALDNKCFSVSQCLLGKFGPQSTECTSSGNIITNSHSPALLEHERIPRRRILVGTSSGNEKSIFALFKFSVSGFNFSSPLMNLTASTLAPAGDEASTTKKSAVPLAGAIFPSLTVRKVCKSSLCCSTAEFTFPSPPTNGASLPRVSRVGRKPESAMA